MYLAASTLSNSMHAYNENFSNFSISFQPKVKRRFFSDIRTFSCCCFVRTTKTKGERERDASAHRRKYLDRRRDNISQKHADAMLPSNIYNRKKTFVFVIVRYVCKESTGRHRRGIQLDFMFFFLHLSVVATK